MSEGAPTPAHEVHNGHGGEALDPAASSPIQARTDADAEELLSQARVHAELMRVHAEAARAEAQALRAEAAALRRAARDEAAAASARAEALTAQLHATAEELRSAMEGQADAARAEVERLRAEAASLRRLLQAETDAGLADTQRMRSEVQGLWAETNKLAAELGLLGARAGATAARDELEVQAVGHAERATAAVADEKPDDRRLDDLRRAMTVEVERRLAHAYAGADDRPRADAETASASAPSPHVAEGDIDWHADPVLPQLDVGELLREIWDAAYTESARLSERGFPGEPAKWTSDRSPNGTDEAPSTHQPDRRAPDSPRAAEPLIGSGGWRASTAATSPAAPVDGPGHREATPPAQGPGPLGRRFRRRG